MPPFQTFTAVNFMSQLFVPTSHMLKGPLKLLAIV